MPWRRLSQASGAEKSRSMRDGILGHESRPRLRPLFCCTPGRYFVGL